MAETIVLDPSDVPAVTHSRSSFEITPWISKDGVDWGDAAVVNSFAAQAVGETSVGYTVPNRQIRIPLSIRAVGGTTFDTARGLIQAKAGLWQGQGGWLKRVTSAGTVWCDIVSAQLHLGGGWLQANASADTDAVLSLEAIPDFYEAEETLSDHTETTLPEITFTETTANGGDFPLGDRVRIVVDDDSANNQRGMFWAWRGRHYSSASTAASAYEAEALQALDTATKVAKGGASGGTVVTHGTISTNWTPVVGTNIGGTTWLTHTGTNRIYARVFSTSGTAVQSRFVYDTADLVNPVENDAVRLYDGGTFHILDLGEVRLDPPPTGTHRWQGMVQAKGNAGAESFSVDRVWVVNQDESAGLLRAPVSIFAGGVPYSARSEFTTESGAMTGDALAVGGNWTVVTNSDTTDFDVTGGVATRTAVSDTGTGSEVLAGRGVTAGSTNYAAIAASVDVKWSAASAQESGLLARVVDSANFFSVTILATTSVSMKVNTIVAGAKGQTDIVLPLSTDTFYTLRLLVTPGGNWVTQVCAQGHTSPLAQLSGWAAALATGGVLASGRVGIADIQGASTAATRTFDNFSAWVPVDDAVVFASQSAELNSAQMIREDSGGTAFGPVSTVYGDLPRMPNRSSAGTVEFVTKLSRGDLQTMPDPAIDDLSTRVYRRASHLLLPS